MDTLANLSVELLQLQMKSALEEEIDCIEKTAMVILGDIYLLFPFLTKPIEETIIRIFMRKMTVYFQRADSSAVYDIKTMAEVPFIRENNLIHSPSFFDSATVAYPNLGSLKIGKKVIQTPGYYSKRYRVAHHLGKKVYFIVFTHTEEYGKLFAADVSGPELEVVAEIINPSTNYSDIAVDPYSGSIGLLTYKQVVADLPGMSGPKETPKATPSPVFTIHPKRFISNIHPSNLNIKVTDSPPSYDIIGLKKIHHFFEVRPFINSLVLKNDNSGSPLATEQGLELNKNKRLSPSEKGLEASKDETLPPTEQDLEVNKNKRLPPTEKGLEASKDGTVPPIEQGLEASKDGTVPPIEQGLEASKDGTCFPTEKASEVKENGTEKDLEASKDETPVATEEGLEASKYATLFPE